MRDVEVVRAQLVGLVAQRCKSVGGKDSNATFASFGRCRVPVSCVVPTEKVRAKEIRGGGGVAT